MNFRDDVLTALGAGENFHALMEVVRRHRVQGLPVADAYEALEAIWLEYGFDKKEAEEGTLQDTLECVMEKVWYGHPLVSLSGDDAALLGNVENTRNRAAERL